MNIKSIKTVSLGFTCSVLLSACGGGGDGGEGPNRFTVERNSATVSLERLKPMPSNGFATHFKNGLYTASINQGCPECSETAADVQDSAAAASSDNYTTTNTQEQGVDEADRIKYDGEHLYVIANPYFDAVDSANSGSVEGQRNYIKVYAPQDGEANFVSSIDLPEDFMSVEGLYLNDDNLMALGNNFEWLAVSFFDIWHPTGRQFNLAMYDVSSAESPQLSQHIQFDGYLLSSRKVDNKLYLVSSYSPTVEGLNYGASSDSQKEHNFNTITATDINTLMPTMTINGSQTQALVTADNCYIPRDAGVNDGYDSLVTLTSIDLDNPENIKSVCVNALTHDIYASTESLYLMGVNNEQQGVIHRFALDDELTYVGTGNVDGDFGWRSASFRLSEYDGHLRVLTSKVTDEGRTHQLFVMDTEGQDNNLPIISQLPNEQRPEPIGKPNDDVYAVRYFNEKAYVVTFERIDPLYVIDIAQPNEPFIAGELEIPGFSSYLHPVNENLLIGVGQDVDEGALPNMGGDAVITIMPINANTKLALFDVSNPSNPIQVQELIYDDAYTPVEWDHHAFTYQVIDDNHLRFALPMSRWYNSDTNTYENEAFLNLLEVNISEAGAEFVEKSPIVAPAPSQDHYFIDSNMDRSVIHDDHVYYIHGNEVLEGIWQ